MQCGTYCVGKKRRQKQQEDSCCPHHLSLIWLWLFPPGAEGAEFGPPADTPSYVLIFPQILSFSNRLLCSSTKYFCIFLSFFKLLFFLYTSCPTALSPPPSVTPTFSCYIPMTAYPLKEEVTFVDKTLASSWICWFRAITFPLSVSITEHCCFTGYILPSAWETDVEKGNGQLVLM